MVCMKAHHRLFYNYLKSGLFATSFLGLKSAVAWPKMGGPPPPKKKKTNKQQHNNNY